MDTHTVEPIHSNTTAALAGTELASGSDAEGSSATHDSGLLDLSGLSTDPGLSRMPETDSAAAPPSEAVSLVQDSANNSIASVSGQVPLPTHYAVADLQLMKDHELVQLLRRVWSGGRKLEVWGKLTETTGNGVPFVKLAEVRSVYDNTLLSYPCDVPHGIQRGVYIDSQYGRELLSAGNGYIRCELRLAPPGERRKHNNPLEVNVKPQSAVLLKEIPSLPVPIPPGERLISTGDAALISQTLFEQFRESKQRELADWESEVRQGIDGHIGIAKEDLAKVLSEHLALQEKLVTIQDELVTAESKKDDLEQVIGQLQHLQNEEAEKLAALYLAHEKAQKRMSQHLERLKTYIDDKATMLKQLGFVDDAEFDQLFAGRPEKAPQEGRINFERDLGGNYGAAVSYIQAHLLQQDILYPRHVLENFFALLRTHDLIILAGDSGSGKTSLVQSFAKAIGGVAKIIPVKPNWTSSEDLLGYYNPLEKKYLSTPFLDALVEAGKNPDVPYLICLDEMNLARVEYYFADFLSKLEQRDRIPELQLFSDTESAHVLSELRHVIDIIRGATEKHQAADPLTFVKLLQDEEVNTELRRAFGFSEQDSLIKYHSDIRRMLAGVLNTPSSIPFPSNVRIIGAINIDETTHYLSPKILDRAHVMKFQSPLLTDWKDIIEQVSGYGFAEVSSPLELDIAHLGSRAPYPKFDQALPFCQRFVELNREYFHPLGVEFGLRAIRQGLNYIGLFADFNDDADVAVNNFMLHKVLPKLTFDGNKEAAPGISRLDLLFSLATGLAQDAEPDEQVDSGFSARQALLSIAAKAKANDGIVNYWS